MSFRYKVLERCIKAARIKKMYDMPEKELFCYLKTKHRACDMPDFMYKQLAVRKTDFFGHLLLSWSRQMGQIIMNEILADFKAHKWVIVVLSRVNEIFFIKIYILSWYSNYPVHISNLADRINTYLFTYKITKNKECV